MKIKLLTDSYISGNVHTGTYPGKTKCYPESQIESALEWHSHIILRNQKQ